MGLSRLVSLSRHLLPAHFVTRNRLNNCNMACRQPVVPEHKKKRLSEPVERKVPPPAHWPKLRGFILVNLLNSRVAYQRSSSSSSSDSRSHFIWNPQPWLGPGYSPSSKAKGAAADAGWNQMESRRPRRSGSVIQFDSSA